MPSTQLEYNRKPLGEHLSSEAVLAVVASPQTLFLPDLDEHNTAPKELGQRIAQQDPSDLNLGERPLTNTSSRQGCYFLT